ncbi:MAG: hypothetical protein ACRC68_05125 [Clostridium sp.]
MKKIKADGSNKYINKNIIAWAIVILYEPISRRMNNDYTSITINVIGLIACVYIFYSAVKSLINYEKDNYGNRKK